MIAINKIRSYLIRFYRMVNNLSLEDVAKCLNTNRSTIMRYESGAIKSISDEKLIQLSKIFNITPEELLIGETEIDTLLDILSMLGYKNELVSHGSNSKQKGFSFLITKGNLQLDLTQNDLIDFNESLIDFIDENFAKLNKK